MNTETTQAGYHCLDCGHDFHEDEAATIEDSELVDDMNDRPASLMNCESVACPECDSPELAEFEFCARCDERPALAGSDYCAPCLREVNRVDAEQAHREAIQAGSPFRDWTVDTVVNRLVSTP